MKFARFELSDHRRHLAIGFATLLLLVNGVLMVPVSLQHAQEFDLADKALHYAAEISGVAPDRLVIVNTAWLGGEILRAKVLDKVAGEIYVTSIHSSGLPATDEEVAELIRVSSQLGFVGKLEERLRLSVDAAPSESCAINIWVRTPSPPLASWQSAIEQGDRQHVFAEAASFHAQAEAPVLQFLHASGVREKYASQYVPMIACTVPNQLTAGRESWESNEGERQGEQWHPAKSDRQLGQTCVV
jgi:hypothetical protein